MEGRALDRQRPPQVLAFMVPLLGAVAAAQIGRDGDAGRAPSLVLGLAAGAAWQLLHRRDLVSRLALPVVAGGLGVAIAVVAGEPIMLGDTRAETTGMLVYAFCVLVGLVLAELRLRRQDRRAGEVSPAGAPATSPGTGSR
ncbi:hypothetical protein [Pimelobacter simplex]|uniref:hypothetical protein n=1 Tax=Nocardioides simplex TaxID=2045 RepID=UPI00193254E6|nr:hypothetical protein [Pimelobacter simplex]